MSRKELEEMAARKEQSEVAQEDNLSRIRWHCLRLCQDLSANSAPSLFLTH